MGNGTYDRLAFNPTQGGPIWDINHTWPGDFNGDGKTDIMSWYQGWFTTWLSKGDGTYDRITYNPTEGGLWDINHVWVGDYNGDGKTDILSWYLGVFTTWLSKGDGAYDMVRFNPTEGSLWDINHVWVGDYNGDGKSDIVSWDAPKFTTWLSKGDGTYDMVAFNPPGGQGWDKNHVWQGDYNGDGKSDLLSWEQGVFTTWQSDGFFPDLLTGIVNPFRGTTTLTYKPLTDDTVYAIDTGTLAEIYPNVDVQSPLYVISHVTVNDGIDTDYNSSYSYGGGKAHHLGRGGLGFRWMATVDETPSVLSRRFSRDTC